MSAHLQVTASDVVAILRQDVVLSVLVIVLGIVVGYLVGALNKRILDRAGVPEAVEGTSFERTARNFGTSTVSLVGWLSAWFVIGVSVLVAISIANVNITELFWVRVTTFLPDLFVAILVLIVGIVVGDKVELIAKERLRAVKLPQISLIPAMLKYSVVYVAALIALGQVGVSTIALVVLLAAYLFTVIFLGGLAFQDLLTSSAAGIYLLLEQPYGIGDTVVIDDREGVVQDLTVLVTWIENDGVEYVIPNRHVLKSGVVCKRRD